MRWQEWRGCWAASLPFVSFPEPTFAARLTLFKRSVVFFLEGMNLAVDIFFVAKDASTCGTGFDATWDITVIDEMLAHLTFEA